MKSILAFLLALLLFKPACAQKAVVEKDHQYYLLQLQSAKDSLYKTILARYDRSILAHPEDYDLGLQKCKLIQHAYYDSNEDYNPNYEEAGDCAKQLSIKFPENPEVLIYRTEFMYGDSLLVYLEELEVKIGKAEKSWDKYKWQVYDQFASHYRYSDENSLKTILYAKLASGANDTLDNSLMLAETYKALGRNKEAVEVLLEKLDSTDLAWQLNQKGTLLLELGEPDEAMRVFRWAAKKDESMEDAGALAKAMMDKGLTAEARPYLLKDYLTNKWRADQKLNTLLDYDLTYGTSDSAKTNYRKYTDEKFFNDPFGVYRIRLLVKAPLAGWSFGDIGRLLMFVVLLIIVFVIPYLWVLPVHFWGTRQRNLGKIAGEATFDWGLRHFWVASSLWLLIDVLSTLFFDYPTIISYFSNEFSPENIPPISKTAATMDLFFMTGNAVFCFAMLKKDDFTGFFSKLKANQAAIVKGIGLALLLRFGLMVYAGILGALDIDAKGGSSVFASASTDAIISVNTYYGATLGFLFVVLIVPVYEEILFRGIFLSAIERNMRFVLANIMQSSVFALVHQDLKLFPFYFAFGMIAGHWTKKSGNLVTSTSMHMLNNLLAFLIILFYNRSAH